MINIFTILAMVFAGGHFPHLWHYNPDPVNARGEPWECVTGGERRATRPYIWGS